METNSFDYSILYDVFSQIIEEDLGMIMIELYGNGKPPKPPYVAFDIVSPHIPLNLNEKGLGGMFESVVSFTVYSKDKLEALTKVNALRNILWTQKATDLVDKNEIVIAERMPVQTRYVDETNNYAYTRGAS